MNPFEAILYNASFTVDELTPNRKDGLVQRETFRYEYERGTAPEHHTGTSPGI